MVMPFFRNKVSSMIRELRIIGLCIAAKAKRVKTTYALSGKCTQQKV